MWQIWLNSLHLGDAAQFFLGIFSLWPSPLILRELFLFLYLWTISSLDRFASLHETWCTSCSHTPYSSFSSASPWTAATHWACSDCRFWEATGAAIERVDATVILSTLGFWEALVTVSTLSNVCRPQRSFQALKILRGNPQTYASEKILNLHPKHIVCWSDFYTQTVNLQSQTGCSL